MTNIWNLLACWYQASFLLSKMTQNLIRFDICHEFRLVSYYHVDLLMLDLYSVDAFMFVEVKVK